MTFFYFCTISLPGGLINDVHGTIGYDLPTKKPINLIQDIINQVSGLVSEKDKEHARYSIKNISRLT